jgi:hypothetical protein
MTTQYDDDDLLTVDELCVLIGGKNKPVSRPTIYRGIARGDYPELEHPSPGIARGRFGEWRDAIKRRAAAQSGEAS